MNPRTRYSLLTVSLAAAISVTGCAGGAAQPGAGTTASETIAAATSSAAPTTSAGATTPTVPAPTPTTTRPVTTRPVTPSRRPQSTRPPSAGPPVDGRNLRACADRACVVRVKPGDRIRFAPKWRSRLIVITAAGGGLWFEAWDERSSPFQGSLSGSGSIETGDVHLDVAGAGPRGAIVRIRPR